MAEATTDANAEEKQTSGMTSTSMTAIISADNTMKQVKVQSQVKTNLEDRAGVLESEIKYDTSGNTEIDNQTDVSDENITEQLNQSSNGYPHIDIKL
jgi:hypothetical protein